MIFGAKFYQTLTFSHFFILYLSNEWCKQDSKVSNNTSFFSLHFLKTRRISLKETSFQKNIKKFQHSFVHSMHIQGSEDTPEGALHPLDWVFKPSFPPFHPQFFHAQNETKHAKTPYLLIIQEYKWHHQILHPKLPLFGSKNHCSQTTCDEEKRKQRVVPLPPRCNDFLPVMRSTGLTC